MKTVIEKIPSKLFYKMRLVAEEDGLEIQTEIFVAIHETPCYWFAVSDIGYRLAFNQTSMRSMRKNEKPIQLAKRKKIKVHKIAKSGSRFAFETPQTAYLHLKLMKQLQLKHMERQKNFIDEFFAKAADNFDDLPNDRYHTEFSSSVAGAPRKTIPGTRDLVHEHLTFY